MYIYWRKLRSLSVLRGEVIAVGENSCKSGYTETHAEFQKIIDPTLDLRRASEPSSISLLQSPDTHSGHPVPR